jgi:polysaccharide export outer membrane protein
MRSGPAALALALALSAAGCGSLRLQVGSPAGAGDAPSQASVQPPAEKRPPRGDAPEQPAGKRGGEEAAIQSALQFVESQQHSYKISAADLVEITVYQEADLNRQVRVSPEGIVSFPLIGQLKLAGLGVPDAEQALREKLKKFLVDPQVSVFIKEYGNKQVYVLGEVAKPGSYQLPTEAPLSVIEAVTLAGGFTQYAAKDRTRVIRKAQGESRTLLIEVSAVMKGDKSKDIQLMTNDVIYVPESFF